MYNIITEIKKIFKKIKKLKGISHVPPRPKVYVINQVEIDRLLEESLRKPINIRQSSWDYWKFMVQERYSIPMNNPKDSIKITNVS